MSKYAGARLPALLGVFISFWLFFNTSVDADNVVLSQDSQVGSLYHVYGADSFTTNEDRWWDKGYHPENYGYAYLGASTETGVFVGSHNYYLINVKPVNIAKVDAIQGSNGIFFYSGFTSGNTNSPSQISGAPDGKYAEVGGKSDGTSGGFVVVGPTSSISFIKVFIADDLQYTLTYSAWPNGSITGEASQSVVSGSDGAPVEAAPDEGCRFVRWSDGRTDNPRTDTKVTSNISVTAEFALAVQTVGDVYDDFEMSRLASHKWTDLKILRGISGGKLNLSVETVGS